MTRHAYLETRAVSLLNIYRIVVIGYICINVNSFYSMMGLRRWKIGNSGFDVGYQTLGAACIAELADREPGNAVLLCVFKQARRIFRIVFSTGELDCLLMKQEKLYI